jgi:hypothetical protein
MSRSRTLSHTTARFYGDAAIDLGHGSMVRLHQTVEKLLLESIEVWSAEVTEEPHPLEPVSPGVLHIGAGRSTERQLLILKCQHLRHGEPGALQLVFQFPAHVEIVPSRREGILGEGRERRLRPRAERLMSEQVIDFREHDPASRFQVSHPSGERREEIRE